MKTTTQSVPSPVRRLSAFYAFAESILRQREPDWADLEAVEAQAHDDGIQARRDGWAPADRTKLNRIERRACAAMDAAAQ